MPKLRSRSEAAVVLLLTLAGCQQATQPQAFDLVVANGRVMDPESGLDAPRHLGIRGGKIVAISERPLVGVRTIDAAGRVVAPGFIDLHSHAHNSLVGGRVQAFDGVTTAIEAEAGQLPIPMAYQKAAATGRAINYGYTASWGLARMAVMAKVEPNGTWEGFESGLRRPGWAEVAATEPQERAINDLVEQALTDGAVGIGLPLGYVPAATTEEIRRLSVLAARHDAVVFVHTRSTVPDSAAVDEAIANAVATGAQWHICHAQLPDRRRLNERMVAARQSGARVTTETMTILGGSTFLGAEYFRPETYRQRGGKPEWIVYYGRRLGSYEELGRVRSADPTALIFIDVAGEPTDETDSTRRNMVAESLKMADWTIASDAMPWTDFKGALLPPDTWPLPEQAWAHPRSAVNYTRAIEKYVQQWKVVTLMEVLRAGSLNPARLLERTVPDLRGKGRIKVGADADLIVFDPAKVRTTATLERPGGLSAGMDYVVVNGQVLIDDGHLDVKSFPGRPIRGTGEPRSSSNQGRHRVLAATGSIAGSPPAR